jgi:hypothetical protein
MASFFPPPHNRLVLEAWSAGVYHSEDDSTTKLVRDLPKWRESTTGTRNEVADLEPESSSQIDEDDAELQ